MFRMFPYSVLSTLNIVHSMLYQDISTLLMGIFAMVWAVYILFHEMLKDIHEENELAAKRTRERKPRKLALVQDVDD